MNTRELNSHLWLLVTLAVAIIAIIYSCAVVNADDGYSVNATVNVTDGGGDGGGDDGGTPGPSGGGGGGGGGGRLGQTSLREYITMESRITEDVTAPSGDKKVTLLIPKGTIAKNRVGSLLYYILIEEEKEPPAPPIGAKRISLCYDIGPAGATFDPPIILTIEYDVSLIPEGVSEENLVIAKYDWATEQWQNLESTVDPVYNTITTKLSYFSTHAVLAYTSPASFTIADLSVTPSEVNIGESVSISVLVTNTGDLTGVYEINIKIDNVVAQTKDVTLDGGDSETISFSVTPDSAGDCTVDVNGLSGKFTVKAPVPTPISEPTPAPEPTPALAPEPTPTPEPEVTARVMIPKILPTIRGYNWGLIATIYGATMVVVGVFVYLLKRTK